MASLSSSTLNMELTKMSVVGENTASVFAPSRTVDITDDMAGITDTLALFSSFGEPMAKSSQFPMQHATPTQLLPSNLSPMTTTDPLSFKSDDLTVQSTVIQNSDGQGQSTVLPEFESGIIAGQSSNAGTDNSDAVSSSSSVPNSSSIVDNSQLLSSVSAGTDNNIIAVSGGADDEIPGSVLVTPTVSADIVPTDPLVESISVDVSAASSQTYSSTSRALYSTYIPTETSFSTPLAGLDSVSLKTTEAASLPPVSGKPMVPDAKGDSTILGGGLSDYIIYVGAPVCGLVILILLIVCIVCIRRRKSKQKGSPVKSHVSDLWVNNSGSEIPLTARSVPEQNGGEAVLTEDIGCTNYEAVFDFKGELSTHLPLKQGDRVIVHRKEAAGWWRGTSGGKTGWFPCNYVQAAPLDLVKTENEIETHDDTHVSTFMLKRPETPNQRRSYIANSPSHRNSYLTDSASHRDSNLVQTANQKQPVIVDSASQRTSATPTEEEILAEPIYCKIQPKDKRDSGADRSNSTTPTKSDYSAVRDLETEYVALYPFVARVENELSINKRDIVLCREGSEKNGWMRGTNVTTQQEGWVPASYVQKVEKEEVPVVHPDPSSYKQLEVNTDMDERQDLVGIVHRAIHTFSAEKAGDLEFEAGDLITVFQVLENGWWLGCKNKTVGWFPGSYVEMFDQPSSSPSPSSVSSAQSHSESPVPSETHSDDTHQLSDSSPRTPSETTPKAHRKSKLKPVRKAPLPPSVIKAEQVNIEENHEADKENKPEGIVENKPSETKVDSKPETNKENKSGSKLPTPGGSRLPKLARPKIPPPLPPTKAVEDHEESPLYDTIKDKPVSANESNKHSVTPESHVTSTNGSCDINKTNEAILPQSGKKDKVKPPVPKRFIKPKLVTVPRHEVQMPDKETLTKGLISGEFMKLRSPPPPKPTAPKLGPIRAKLSEPKPFEEQSPTEDGHGYFQVTPRKMFGDIPRQESNENESDSDPPYRTLSSFGMGSFGGPRTSAPLKANETVKHMILEEKKDEINGVSEPSSAAVETIKPMQNANSISSDPEKGAGKMEKEQHLTEGKVDDTKLDKHDTSDVESKVKSSGIPVTPKMKVSKLPPPKPVSAKVLESPDAQSEGSKNISDSNITSASPNKLPTAPKPVSTSKILADTHGGPKVAVNDADVFQYPEVNQSKQKDTDVDHKDEFDIKDRSFEIEDSRPRTDSIGKPPVAPKPKSGLSKLAKPKSYVKKDTQEDKMVDKSPGETEQVIDTSADTHSSVLGLKHKHSESESETESKTDKVVTPSPGIGSKIPLGSSITQQSPKQRGRKSSIPSPGLRTRSSDRSEKVADSRKLSESESENPTSPTINLRHKPESPRSGRKIAPKQIGNVEKQSLRNRSNSPAGRSGIPTIRNRSNSPASKPTGIPVPGTNSPTGISSPKVKPSGIVPPKKILNGVEDKKEEQVSPSIPELTEVNNVVENSDDELEKDSSGSKPERPSKPPRVQKQASHDGKPPKQGKSLLPVVHKTMEAGSGSQSGVPHSSAGTKPKRGIPVAKPTRPLAPKSGSPDSHSEAVKKTLYQAVKGYTAQLDGELSFSEGTFVKELSDCDRPGWNVGMLADGTTGLYPADHFKPSPVSAQSEA